MSAIQSVIALGFWCCVAAVAFAYAGYPVLIYVLSRLFGRAGSPAPTPDDQLPRVSLLIAAHNEESVIEARLRNALATDYPPDRLDIVVASDGCVDATPAIVRRFAGRGVRLLHAPHRRGKAATINRAMPQLSGELVVLSDANTEVDPAAVRALVRWFADPRVGVACGRLILNDAATGRNADGVYWNYETFLKRCEGRLGALLGANGAIYAIRRSSFVPIPNGTIVDDFMIPLVAKLETGCTIVYDADAVAREETAPDVRSEFRRRARIGAGGFQTLRMLWRLLDPRRGWVSVAFCSHKLLRWCCPFFMLGALLSSALLWPHPIYRAALLGQVAFYSIASMPARVRLPRFMRAAQMFTGMNAALLVGFWRWWNDAQTATWEPTERAAAVHRRAA